MSNEKKSLTTILDHRFDGDYTVSEVLKDLPLYSRLMERGQTLPTWMAKNLIELVRLQSQEMDRLAASEFREVEIHGQTISDRDDYHEMADRLANAIASYFREDIGEHSSGHCPWLTALALIEGEVMPGMESADGEQK